MKSLIIILASIILAVQSEEVPNEHVAIWNQMAGQYIEECIKQSGANPKLVMRMMTHKEFPKDKTLYCYVKCIGLKLNFTSEDEVPNRETLANIGMSDEIIDKCTILKGDNFCETAYKIGTCIYDNGAHLAKIYPSNT